MDRVRLGRVLGTGTRLAAKTLVSAVEAANAPNPSGADAGPSRAAGNRMGMAAGQKTRETVSQTRVTAQGVKRGGKRFGEAVWSPFIRLSGVLWLEVTGVFFGVFALFAGAGVWKHRAALHDRVQNHQAFLHLLVICGVALVFGYFCVSSFVKANRRSRRR